MTPTENSTNSGALRFRPNCNGIDPDADNRGYFCRNCGMDLIPVKNGFISAGWFRHGKEWRHPELGR